ncbi:metallophosphoesterase [Brucepastera parasyntrophica]|uniref:metallophosphoesterase family protein n=1 Tax=Brucepastera parasyntrophica TaxID=2880008 RepID=UPI00210A0105|nr:metallophosphoesterase [Brucepastera parasyntrophica]ULQ60725.1 metallophosphoesterase [Brucepastera parasyntrophica]
MTALVLIITAVSCSWNVSGAIASGDFRHRWAARDTFVYVTDRTIALNESYSFLVLTDAHLTDDDSRGLEKIAQEIAGGGDSFVVITGDITDGGKSAEIRKFIKIAETFGVPCYPVIGNHDIFSGNWSNWKDLIGSTVYRIDSTQATFLFLDSANAFFGSNQLEWLESNLKTAKKNTFVFTHCNLFTDSIVNIQQLTDIRERARIMGILDGKCRALFMGHVHKQMENTAGGVRYITLQDFKTKGTYCRVSVTPQKISYSFHSIY